MVLGSGVLSIDIVQNEAENQSSNGLDEDNLVVHVESLSTVLILTDEGVWEVSVLG